MCARASLNYTTSSGDAGTVVRLTVLPGQPCRARYVWNGWTANFEGLSGPKTTAECPVWATSTEIHLDCPDLPEKIPSR
jgi:hypothetical protein